MKTIMMLEFYKLKKQTYSPTHWTLVRNINIICEKNDLTLGKEGRQPFL